MSFLGKILVVVQVVLTILFMAFAGAVSATHTSWKQAHENVTKQLADKDQSLRAEEARAKAEKLELETKLSAATEAAALKDADNRDLKSRLDTLTAEYDQVKTAAAVKTQLASIAADDNEARQEEATRLREVAQNRLKSYEVVIDELKKSKDEANELAQERRKPEDQLRNRDERQGDSRTNPRRQQAVHRSEQLCLVASRSSTSAGESP